MAIIRKFWLIFLTVFLAFNLAGTQYYVSTSGNDSNNGTSISTPWQTFVHAYSHTTSGDVVSLDSTNTFTGPLTGYNGLTWNSYGNGRALIVGDTNNGAFTLTNQANVTITNLSFQCPMADTNDNNGFDEWCMVMYSSTANGTKYLNNTIENCYITGAQIGIFLVATDTNQVDGFYNLQLNNNTITNETVWGIDFLVLNYAPGVFGRPTTFQFGYPLISNNLITHIIGDTADTSAGSGMFVYNTYGGLIISNTVINCGISNLFVGPGGGPSGILNVACVGTTNQNNWISNVWSRANAGSPVDGDGIDMDENTYNCIVNGNFITDCGGPALYSYCQNGTPGAGTNNIFEWNITTNNALSQGSECVLQGTGEQVYNNTLIGTIRPAINTSGEVNGLVENNILVSGNATVAIYASSTTTNINNIAIASATYPNWLNILYQPVAWGPAAFTATYMTNNGGVDFYGTPIGPFAYNIGAVNSTAFLTNTIEFSMPTNAVY